MELVKVGEFPWIPKHNQLKLKLKLKPKEITCSHRYHHSPLTSCVLCFASITACLILLMIFVITYYFLYSLIFFSFRIFYFKERILTLSFVTYFLRPYYLYQTNFCTIYHSMIIYIFRLLYEKKNIVMWVRILFVSSHIFITSNFYNF